ncbi:MAG: hypothetical protein IIB28_02625 [Chloroflexi bacterium]|nr:hypothetical protein [Chloroflexota bacterium]
MQKNIGLCMLPVAASKPGQRFEVAVRQRQVEAEIVRTPFYSRKK